MRSATSYRSARRNKRRDERKTKGYTWDEQQRIYDTQRKLAAEVLTAKAGEDMTNDQLWSAYAAICAKAGNYPMVTDGLGRLFQRIGLIEGYHYQVDKTYDEVNTRFVMEEAARKLIMSGAVLPSEVSPLVRPSAEEIANIEKGRNRS